MGYENGIKLQSFLGTAVGKLSEEERETIIDQAAMVLDQLYAHLPLKRAMFAIDPLQRLRLLKDRLQLTSELDFHREMLSIFIELRDLHTLYCLPEPFRSHTAILPFLIEEYFDDGQPHYLVSKVDRSVSAPHLRGAEVTHWNGVPIARQVVLHSMTRPGGNDAARRARGLSSMTLRPLRNCLWPDEQWVELRYHDAGGEHREVRFDWRVVPLSQRWLEDADDAAEDPGALAGGIDKFTEAVRRTRKELFAPGAMDAERKMDALWEISAGADAPALTSEQVAAEGESLMPDNLSFRTVTTSQGDFGYLRIWSFENTGTGPGRKTVVDFIEAFVKEVRRIISILPKNGLLIDVRGNAGGRIPAGEQILELFTPQPIVPAPFHFRNTPLVRELCRLAPAALEISKWEGSVGQAVATGSVYSRGYTFVPFSRQYNRVGQEYHGPVVLIVDALCYSTTDIFAAGFQDHDIGPVLGVDTCTGAGGANMWPHGVLTQLLRESPLSKLVQLPGGVSINVAVRQAMRVGPRAGEPLEDLGVKPDRLHKITRNDILNKNQDLIEHAGQILARMVVRVLDASAPQPLDDSIAMTTITTRNIARVDVYLDGRPHASLDTEDGDTSVQLRAMPQSSLELIGWDGAGGEHIVARRTIRIER